MKTRSQSRWQKVLIITLCWSCFGCLLYIVEYSFLKDLILLKKISGEYPFWPDFFGNGVVWAFGGLVAGYFLVFKMGRTYRKGSFAFGIINSGLVFLVMFLLLVVIMFFSLAFIFAALDTDLASAFRKGVDNVRINVVTPSFFVAMGVWGFLVSVTQFMLQVNDKFGPGILWKFITGKYYHPREEERIFMFMDLKSSTAIAEKMGSKLFFVFLKEIYHDITEPIMESLGEIYQYIGDEVVITWPVQHGLQDNNCVLCFFRIEKVIEAKREYYLERFGVFPVFKAGFHLGEATVGEIGVIKKDIVFSGDVLNTASRIQGQCNFHKVKILISSDLLQRMPMNGEYQKTPVGEIRLRGKTEKVALTAIDLV